MTDKTTTTETKKDSAGNKTETTTQTESDKTPAVPAQPNVDAPKRGPGSDTNPSGIGGNESSVSG